MERLIPKAIAYARNVRAIENNSYQAWLRQVVEREDLIAWAQKEEPRHLRDDLTEYVWLPWWRRAINKVWGAIP